MVREYGRKGTVQAIIGYLGGYILLQIVFLGLYSLYMRWQNIVITNDMIVELTIVSTFVSSFVTLAIFIYFFRNILSYDFLRFQKNGSGLKYVFAGFAGLYLVNIAITLLYGLFGIEGSSLNQDLVQQLILEQPLLMALPVIVFVPFIEEIVFRGALYELLLQKVSVVGSVFIVNAAFAILHVVDFNSLIFLPVYFLLGVVLSSVYIISGKNIWVSIFAHSLHNLLSVLAILFVLS